MENRRSDEEREMMGRPLAQNLTFFFRSSNPISPVTEPDALLNAYECPQEEHDVRRTGERGAWSA